MKSYDALKSKLESPHRQIVDAKMLECTYTLKKFKELYNVFSFTAGMQKATLTEGGKKK